MVSNQLVKRSRGERLPIAADCPTWLSSLIKQCWAANPDVRLSANEVVKTLRSISGRDKTSVTIGSYCSRSAKVRSKTSSDPDSDTHSDDEKDFKQKLFLSHRPRSIALETVPQRSRSEKTPTNSYFKFLCKLMIC